MSNVREIEELMEHKGLPESDREEVRTFMAFLEHRKNKQPLTPELKAWALGADEPVTNGNCVQAGKLWVDKHGVECWINLCIAWNMPQTLKHEKSKDIFLAGLAMGFVECLKFVRDTGTEQ